MTIAGRSLRRLDPFAVAAGAFLLLALAFGAYPAFRAGPGSLGGALVLGGLAGVAFFAILALRGRGPGPAEGIEVLRLIEAIGEPVALATADGRILTANPGWGEIVGPGGRLPKSVDAGGLFSALSVARRGEVGQVRLKLKRGERSARVSLLDERRFLVEIIPEPVILPPAETLAIPAAANGPRPVELDAFAGAAPFGAALLDGRDAAEATIVHANPALEAMVGGKPLAGVALQALIEPAAWTEAMQAMESGRAGPFEVRLAHDPASIAHLYLASGADGFIAYLVDVTAQKQMELQLAQSEKMRAIGQFVGGVAHDFNNLLTAITLKGDELFLRHPVGDPSYQDLVEVRSTADRAADLVRKLLAYSRKQTLQREVLELGGLVSEIEVLLRRLLREDVKLETDHGRNPPLVFSDKGQIETAVMNLAINARDAVRAQGGGVVRIRTARLSHAEAKALGYADPRAGPGEVAMIEVSDNGPGIPPDLLGKIFDPFFTTKPVGEGTGLGLSTVYGIVKQADGWIEVVSTLGEGAAFRIFLPVYAPPPVVAAVMAAIPPVRPAARDLSGVGRILFVEDEDLVREVAARLLRARGYEVLEAADGEAALNLAEEYAGKIDLLISDVIMPGIDGPTLLKKARGFLGDAPVMFISGYAEAEFRDVLEGETGVTFLPKPLDIKILAERVKQQLQAA
ncbi:MAG TPA: ATP-binding protein [Caulobacteraceae bacterium]|jgi:two-component system cell cycle sensor histidine kinase/response regulator CckA|nr:ATP-binding protein [Caulobacteraceae bacterium]